MDKIPPYLAANVSAWPEDFTVAHETQPQFAHLESRFGVKCKCGSSTFTIKAVLVSGEEYCYEPLQAECTECKSEVVVFDRYQHGWSGSFFKEARSDWSDGEPAGYYCHSCNNPNFRLAVELSYPNDDESELQAAADEAGVSVLDLFTWISIYGKCLQCGKQTLILSDECDYRVGELLITITLPVPLILYNSSNSARLLNS